MLVAGPGVPPVQLLASDQLVLALLMASAPLQTTWAASKGWMANHSARDMAQRDGRLDGLWLGDGTGGETPPEPAGGTPSLRGFMERSSSGAFITSVSKSGWWHGATDDPMSLHSGANSRQLCGNA